MTIIAGFCCQENLLLCADREESSGASRRVINKLRTLMADPYVLIVANAGSSALADLAMKRLQLNFVRASGNLKTLETDHEQIIIDTLTKLYEEHVWNNPRTHNEISLIIALSFTETSKAQYLYLTQDNIPQPISTYCCKGYGEDLCTYFAEHLYHPLLTAEEGILLASLIFREVNSSVQFCGKGTDMALLRPGERAMTILPFGVEEIQKKIPEFSRVMSSFWESIEQLPEWLKQGLQERKKDWLADS